MGEVVAFIGRQAQGGAPSGNATGEGQILLFTGAWRERLQDATDPKPRRPSKGRSPGAAQKRRKKSA